MERNANYTLVGFVSLALIVAMVAFIVWFGRYQFRQENQDYDIVFVGSVSGLVEGSEVQFNGIKVGEVTDLSLDAADPNRVIARARLGSDIPVRTDSYATLEPLGITGVNFVQITAGNPQNALLKDVTPEDKIPVIRTQPGLLSDLLAGGGTVLARTVEALDQVTSALSDRNIANFSGMLEDLSIVTAAARENVQVFDNVNETMANLNETARSITELSKATESLVNTQGVAALNDASEAASEFKEAAKDIRELVAALRAPTTDFATNTLPEVQRAVGSLQGAAESLERLVNEIEQDPRSLVTKEPGREIEVAP